MNVVRYTSHAMKLMSAIYGCALCTRCNQLLRCIEEFDMQTKQKWYNVWREVRPQTLLQLFTTFSLIERRGKISNNNISREHITSQSQRAKLYNVRTPSSWAASFSVFYEWCMLVFLAYCYFSGSFLSSLPAEMRNKISMYTNGEIIENAITKKKTHTSSITFAY